MKLNRFLVYYKSAPVAFAICLSSSLLTNQSFAQNQPFKEVSIASPNAASLGKYGDVPVSKHTGIPETTLPIYTLQDGPLQVPINLSYHAGGLKVMEPASWVGTGWSLNAGGVITRSVEGGPDDHGFGAVTNFHKGHFTDYGYNSYLFISGGQGNGPPLTSDNMQADDATFIRGEKDGEPDLYFFNFNGYSGKFYFRDDRTPVVVPEEDFKIEPILVIGIVYIQGFVITTSDGTKYYFGKNQYSDGNIDAFETTSPYTIANGLTNGIAISSWYLTKIVSADDRHSIKLIYQPEKYSYYTISMFPVSSTDPPESKGFTLVKNYIEGVRLSQIISATSTINFISGSVRTDLGNYQTRTISDIVNTESKTLGTIQVKDNLNTCKNFVFSYNYFIDNTSALSPDLGVSSIETDKKRLRLDAIQEADCSNTQTINSYAFSYIAPSGNNSFVPRRLSFAQDHWGFYNGRVNNMTLIPTYTVNKFTKYNGADREPSWPEMSYGTLNKIRYPTGGNTQFVFEPNDIWANFTYNSEQLRATESTGPGIGQSLNKTITINATGNPYKFTLDYNTNPYATTGSASFAGMSVDRTNRHAEVIMQPATGTQTYILYNNMSSQNTDFATATISEEVPSTYQSNKIVGGLRIKDVSNYDGVTSNVSTTSYIYQAGGQSTGVLYSRPSYVQIPRNDIVKQVGGYSTPGNCSPNGCLSCDFGLIYLKSPCSTRPMNSTQGNHIGYRQVKVNQTGNGYSIYKFVNSDIWDANQKDVAEKNVNLVCDAAIPNFPAAPLPFEYRRGELWYEGHFNESGQLIKESSYYPKFIDNPIKTPAYIATSWATTTYELSTARKSQVAIISNYNTPSGNTLTTIDTSFYESPYHHQVTRRVTVNSKGERLETKYKYAFDFRIPACDALSDCHQNYANSSSNANSIYNNQLYMCTSGTWNCKWVAYQQYRRDLSIARNNYISCRQTNFTNPTNAYKTAHDQAKAGAGTELKPLLEMQDQFMNVPIETTIWNGTILTGASFNRYDFVSNPAGKVYLNKTQRLPITTPSAIFTSSATSGSTIVKDGRYTDEDQVKFDKGNLVEVIKKDGVVTTYIWGYNNSYPVAKVVGISYSQISAMATPLSQTTLQSPASDAALRTELNRVRSTFPAALVTTYTYKPVLGITSETDANNRTTYYEYDALGRLKLLRDKDNNILKKFCYNYQGQVENCN